jgi:hypothetical protein
MYQKSGITRILTHNGVIKTKLRTIDVSEERDNGIAAYNRVTKTKTPRQCLGVLLIV